MHVIPNTNLKMQTIVHYIVQTIIQKYTTDQNIFIKKQFIYRDYTIGPMVIYMFLRKVNDLESKSKIFYYLIKRARTRWTRKSLP